MTSVVESKNKASRTPINDGVLGRAERALVNSVLSYIAGFVVLLLFAALVGPSIVDWNAFRAEIEAQISETVGRDVTISGDINFVILPAPRFSLGELSIGGAEVDVPLAHVGVLEGEVALAPLLRAEVDVVRVRARDFTANIHRDESGRLNWATTSGPALDVAIDPEAVSLESMLFENGEVLFRNDVSNSTARLSNISGELAATSLVGPLKFDGGFEYDNASYELSFGVGAFGGDRAFPVNIDLAAQDHGWTSSFSGLSTDATTSARLDGNFDFRLGQSEQDGEVSSFLQMTAGFVGSSEIISLRDVDLSIAGATLKGEAEVSLEDGVNVTASLSGARLAVDRILAGLKEAEIPIEAAQIPEFLTGALDLSVLDLSFGPAHASGVRSALRLESGTVRVESLSAELPGETSALFKGTFGVVQGTPRFDGSVEADIGDASAFARWAGGFVHSEAPIEGSVDRTSVPVRLTSELALQPALLQAYSLSLLSGDFDEERTPVTGGLSLALRGRPAVSVELQGPSMDAGWLESFLDLQSLNDVLDPSSFDATVILGFETLTFSEDVLTDVDVSASLADGVLSVERFTATLNGADEVSAMGTVSNIGPFATGGLEGTINTGLATSLGSMLLRSELPSVDEGTLGFELRGEDTEEGHLATLNMSGEVDGSAISLTANQRRDRSSEQVEKLDLIFSMENPSAQTMLAQTGIERDELAAGAGRVRLQVSGRPNEALDTSLRLSVGDFTGGVTGKTDSLFDAPQFKGRFEASAPTFGLVRQVAGWQGGFADLVSANARDGAFVVGGGLEWSQERMVLSEVEAVAGALRASGSGALVFDEAEPAVDAIISLGAVDLDPVFAADGDDPWPAEPLNWRLLAEAKGSLSLSASKATVAGIVFEDVAANGTLGDGVLSLTPITTEFAGGRLTAGARIEGGEGVPGLGLTLAAEDLSVSQTSQMLFARELAEGEATASLQLEGRGRSLLGMVSTLTGKGSLALTDGALHSLDLEAFRTALGGLAVMDDFEPVAAVHLNAGRTPFSQIEGAFSIEEGLLTFEPSDIGVAGATDVGITALADFVRLEADIETDLVLSGDKPLPPMTMVLSGPFPSLERRNDTLAIQQAVSQALLVRGIEEAGIEELPGELRDLIVGPEGGAELDVPLDGVLETPGPEAPTPVARPTN